MSADYHLENEEEKIRERIKQGVADRAAELVVVDKMSRERAIREAQTESTSIEDSRPEHVITDVNGNAIGTVEHTPIPTPKPFTEKQKAQIRAVSSEIYDELD